VTDADPPADQVNACAELVRRGDPDRFLIAMAAPPAARARLFPILAMNVEVSRAPFVTAEPIIARMRLQWWHDAVAEALAGKPPRAHEVAAPLARVMTGMGLPQESLDRLIAARIWDIEGEGFDDTDAFRAHIEATGGELVWLAAASLGLPDGQARVARDAGFAMGLANWFMAIPAYEARGVRPLADGRAEAVRALAEEGLERLASARAARGVDPAIPALRLASLARPVLARARRDPAAVAQGRLAPSEFAKKSRILVKSLTGGW